MTAPARGATVPRGRVAWRYTFCDLRTLEPIAQLPLIGAEFEEVLNGAGAGSGSVPITSATVRQRDPWAATTPRRTCLFAQRVTYLGGRQATAPVLWGGIVWSRKRSGRSMSLGLATFESYWQRRLTARDRTFSNVDDARILEQIVRDTEAVPGGSLGLTYAVTNTGVRSDRTVLASDLKRVLELAESISGTTVEWRIVPSYNAQLGRFALQVQIGPRVGRAVAPHLQWVSKGRARAVNEVLGYELTEDGSETYNRIVALGSGTGTTQLRAVANASDVGNTEVADGYPLLEGSLGASTNELETQAYLDRHARDELLIGQASETQVTSLTVRGDRGPGIETYGLGDNVELRLNDPLQQIPRTFYGRILGRKLQPGQQGRNETVGMTLGLVA